jgi:hypothetical protein
MLETPRSSWSLHTQPRIWTYQQSILSIVSTVSTSRASSPFSSLKYCNITPNINFSFKPVTQVIKREISYTNGTALTCADSSSNSHVVSTCSVIIWPFEVHFQLGMTLLLINNYKWATSLKCSEHLMVKCSRSLYYRQIMSSISFLPSSEFRNILISKFLFLCPSFFPSFLVFCVSLHI